MRQALTLPESLSSAINVFSKGEKATLFMTLLAAFKVLLHRRTGEHDISSGHRSPVVAVLRLSN